MGGEPIDRDYDQEGQQEAINWNRVHRASADLVRQTRSVDAEEKLFFQDTRDIVNLMYPDIEDRK